MGAPVADSGVGERAWRLSGGICSMGEAYLFGAIWAWFSAKADRIEEELQKIAAAKRVRSLLWVGLFSAAASLVNPYGWNLYRHISSYLSNRFLMDHIAEFQSPNFHRVAPKCFLVLLLITLAVLAARRRELRMSQGFTILFSIYAGAACITKTFQSPPFCWCWWSDRCCLHQHLRADSFRE